MIDLYPSLRCQQSTGVVCCGGETAVDVPTPDNVGRLHRLYAASSIAILACKNCEHDCWRSEILAEIGEGRLLYRSRGSRSSGNSQHGESEHGKNDRLRASFLALQCEASEELQVRPWRAVPKLPKSSPPSSVLGRNCRLFCCPC